VPAEEEIAILVGTDDLECAEAVIVDVLAGMKAALVRSDKRDARLQSQAGAI
jgi:hypothetical protein